MSEDAHQPPSAADATGAIYDALLADVATRLDTSRHAIARAVSTTMTATYWQIGRIIVEHEQAGAPRADYGKMLLPRLAADLTARFERGSSRQNIQQMRQFSLTYPTPQMRQTVSGASSAMHDPAAVPAIVRIVSARSPLTFPLPWSHYVRLLAVNDPAARDFYAAGALRAGWSVRQLDRQVATLTYERGQLARGRDTPAHTTGRPDGDPAPTNTFEDPYVLEFLDLRDDFAEHDVEEALIRHREGSLLELGGGVTFVARQRHRRVGDTWYRVDLLLFHRRLRCLVVLELKRGAFTQADAGQMHLYLNYPREHRTLPDENPPVGLIRCTAKDDAVATMPSMVSLTPFSPPSTVFPCRTSKHSPQNSPARASRSRHTPTARILADQARSRVMGTFSYCQRTDRPAILPGMSTTHVTVTAHAVAR